ncbi:MAG: M55 family metallopeptidase [Candidatus Heimdallarchaeota archaeon]|nr:M55 family metallopeptidase [Candidatus Heimdallarchaeota archaeon]MCK4955533.1 M55 family metallopeptidase [Candidatus Heimdallarchaeota archaeon]
MKAFISVDLEGMPYVVIPGQLGLKGSLYEEARKIATKITLIVTDELHKNGFDKIIIADSHGPMINLLIDDLPECVEIIRGSLRPISMVAGVKGCDIAMFLGYHAKFGTTKATFDHTYDGGSVHKILVNGVEASELLLNGYVAGEYGVPTGFVAGDKKLIDDDVVTHVPWAESVALKYSLSRLAARSPSMIKLESELRKGVNKTVIKFNEGELKPLVTKKPVHVELTFRSSNQTDAVSLLPNVTRLDGLTIEYTSKDMVEAYNMFQALMYISSAAMSMLQYLQ